MIRVVLAFDSWSVTHRTPPATWIPVGWPTNDAPVRATGLVRLRLSRWIRALPPSATQTKPLATAMPPV
jgi:hypothetical protein